MKQKIINFIKMSGAGNDFLVLEAVKGLPLKKLARAMCDRTNGIGADGLLILGPSRKAEYRMRIINADGSEAEMCGNGARCLAAYIARYKREGRGQATFTIETLAGILDAEAREEQARVRLSPPSDYRPDIALMVNKRRVIVQYIDTGVPHIIIYVDHLKDIDVNRIAPAFRYHKKFMPRGTNVNFVEQLKPGLVGIRTYERGVEAETKACGTGSVAAALVTFMKTHPGDDNITGASMNVLTQSGEVLNVIFDMARGQFKNVYLKGSAHFIAQGQFFV
ncbi:MAG TPA: diaminopimelate epimerase [Candidatus Omnitrophota bacterium]|nr:diaminopimelate epimerase [Candidatus Omnitrophota bacterium]HQO58050.1 diaminopimelate epimerase [Candidatus Omnitrophota bacterium]HQP12360.1 diaminopimelate epimerase [Candidatus Omnitrophota bacterium]